ncbi:LPS assembly lipoprotein LptE [Alteromonas ponticola]|uniref:LPS-assembly lipoprotein LptE n=1 Tax=Alteromonas ponticola TaxID=2720613 RepID=A0ABX1QZY3_9ALTE|nr:LPS assembly lipoprotein LptE [Alteromonas ponticola]NMH58588.1 hypothetical protein [Alteromonas ponticola]
MTVVRLLVIVSFIILIVACGFKLRGDHRLPAGYDVLHVEAMQNHAPLQRALVQRLDIYNIKLVERRDNANLASSILISLAPEKLERRLLSVFSTGQVAEYELILGVPYTVRFGANDVMDAYFEVVRDYQDDPDQVLAKSKELELVLSEMRREAADRIIRRLASQSSAVY